MNRRRVSIVLAGREPFSASIRRLPTVTVFSTAGRFDFPQGLIKKWGLIVSMKFFGLFRNNAIIQRDKPISVRGYSDRAAVCRLQGGSYDVRQCVTPNAEGKFHAEFPSVSDTESVFTLSLENEEEQIRISLRFGDVLLLLGQSNMAYGVGSLCNREEIKAEAKHAEIAVFDIFEAYVQENGEIFRPDHPMDDFEKDWKWIDGGSEELGASSGVGVMTALLLYRKTRIPIGLVNTSLGGVSIDTYLPRETADECEIIKKQLIRIDKYIPANGKYNIYGGANYSQLGGIFNEKIAPISDCKFNAILWYQGENGVSDFEVARYYAVALETLIKKYKRIFGEDVLFCATNIALDYYNYSHWGYNYINEAIDLAAEKGGAVSFPAYDASMQWMVEDGATYYHPIHPVDKKLIAKRFAKAVYTANATKKPWIPPYIYKVTSDRDRLIAEIYPETVKLKEQKIYGFTVAGADGKFVIAEAKAIGSNKVAVYSPFVREPKELTYAFSPYNNRCNLKTCGGDSVKQYRTTVEDADCGRYIELNAFGDCSMMFAEERNFGADLGCIGKVKVFRDGRITGTNRTRLKIVKNNGDKCLRVDFVPDNKGYYFFGFSPEINVPGYDVGIEKYRYVTLKMRANIPEVEFHGALVREEKGKIHRFTGAERIVKMSREQADYTLNLDTFIEGDLSARPSDPNELKKINTLEFYFRSKKSGRIEVDSIVFHD